MLPCLSHLTYTYTTKKTMNKNNNDNKHKHNKMTHYHCIFEHQGSSRSSYALNVHTIAQFDFILFQQVF